MPRNVHEHTLGRRRTQRFSLAPDRASVASVPTLRLTILCTAMFAAACSRGSSRDNGAQPAATERPSDPPSATPSAATPSDVPAAAAPEQPAGSHLATARALAKELLIVDGHVDVPMRVQEVRSAGGAPLDFSKQLPDGNFDYVRAKTGGLDAPFMSIYTPASYEGQGAKAFAESLIDMVRGFASTWPEQFALVHSVEDLAVNFSAGKISLPMGMENGAPIEGNLDNLAHFHERGIRYITLAHSKDNHISDSSYDDRHTHKGLSDFGKKVVAEMNRVGIMIDVSHISDDAFRQVIELTKVPVIASHSSCRKFTPGWERNMDDWMIRMLADNGGVIQINFGSSFLSDKARVANKAGRDAIEAELAAKKVDPDSEAGKAIADAYWAAHPRVYADVRDVADHIDHVVKLVGIDHVGLGSDFDGVGDSLPTGLKDVSDYPNLFAALLARGYTRNDLAKLAGANVVRVWRAVESYAVDQRRTAATEK